MRILNDVRKYNPNVLFLLENVEMGKKWERVLSEAIGVYGVHINSALVSAQNRKRIYWTNIRTCNYGLFGDLHSDIPQPKDRGILLKDILEDEVYEKYFLSDKLLSFLHSHSIKMGMKIMIKDDNDKASCLCCSQHKRNLQTNYYKDKKGIRVLTPTEWSKLQTIPESYIWDCSDTQQMIMLGNGWTVEIIKHIFSFIPNLEQLKSNNNESAHI